YRIGYATAALASPRCYFHHGNQRTDLRQCSRRLAGYSGCKSHCPMPFLYLLEAFQFVSLEPGLFAVLAVAIQDCQVPAPDCPLYTPRGEAKHFSGLALGFQFHAEIVAYLRHMRQ